MITMSGIVFPDEAREFVQSAHAANHRVLLSAVPGGDCPNCGGMKWLSLDEIISGPQSDAFGIRSVSLFHSHYWYLGNRRQFACPMCNGDQRERLELLWRDCGLEPGERDWHLDFISGEPGKEGALQAAYRILEQTPRPTGWTLIHGGYGVGKSGLFKSLVAAFIRAGVSARYVKAFDILEEVKASFGSSGGGESTGEVWARFMSYRFLAIDEIEFVPDADWSYKAMRNLIDHRYDTRLRSATAFAMNSKPEELGERLAYLDSRLRDGQRVPMSGRDLRE